MVAPSMILIAIVAVWPIIYAIWLSLHEYSVRVAGLSRWAGPFGLRNYSNALSDPRLVVGARAHADLHRGRRSSLELLIGLAMAHGHARGVQGPGPAAHRRAGPVGGAHGRHRDHVADDLRVAVRAS